MTDSMKKAFKEIKQQIRTRTQGLDAGDYLEMMQEINNWAQTELEIAEWTYAKEY